MRSVQDPPPSLASGGSPGSESDRVCRDETPHHIPNLVPGFHLNYLLQCIVGETGMVDFPGCETRSSNEGLNYY